ncbi:MAG: hypothetical protein ACJ8KU_08875 [Chthoniobacterales bacterium]
MLPSRDGRSTCRSAPFVILILLLCASAAFAADKIRRNAKAKPSASPNDLTSIPLPVGHEAKGLVLPNYDADGRLVGRLEAQAAKRTDQEHILFSGLKLTTFTEANQTDLLIEMSESIFNLKTRVVTSGHRTTIERADFNIVGDSLEFDTNSRQGKLVGHVKMVITGKENLGPKADSADE